MLSVKVVCAKVASQDMWNRMDNVVHKKHVDIFEKLYNTEEQEEQQQDEEEEEDESDGEEQQQETTSIRTSHFEFHFEFGSKRPPRDSLAYTQQDDSEEEEEENEKEGFYDAWQDLPSVTPDAQRTFENITSNIYIGSATGRSMAEESMPCECKYDSELDDPTEACGDDNLCINRMMFMECIVEDCPCGRLCRNRRFQLGQYARVDVILTEKKGFGLRALEDLPTNTFIMEYIGEVIPQTEFIRRTREYDAEGYTHYYFMTLKNDEIIDATKRGCLARFINHSCNPNCVTQKWVIGKKMRIGIFTSRFVAAGEELTFDYKFERYGATAQKCYCGEPNCKGFIGASDEKVNHNSNSHRLKNIIINTYDEDEDESDPSDEDDPTPEEEEEMDVLSTAVRRHQPLEDPQQVRSFVKRMLNSVGKPRLVNKLLMRLKATNPNNSLGREVLKTIVRLHGLKMLKFWLGEWKNNEIVVKKVLEVLEVLPLANRNGLEDCKMFDIVHKFTDHDNEEISQLSQRLLDEWSELKSVYRIPKRAHTVTKPILEEEEEEDDEEEDEEHEEHEIIEKDHPQQKPSHKHPKYHQKPFRLKGKAARRGESALKKPRYYESTREFFDPDEDYFEYFSMQTSASEIEWMMQYPPQPVIPTAPRAMLEPSQTPDPTPTSTTITANYYYPATTNYYDMNTQYIDYQNYNSSMYYTTPTVDGTIPTEEYYYAYQPAVMNYQEQQPEYQSQWGTALTEEGAVYYYNIETGEAQWQAPQTDQVSAATVTPAVVTTTTTEQTTPAVIEEVMTPTLSTSGSVDVDESGHLNDIELKRQIGKIVTKYLSAKQQALWKGDRTLFKDLARKVTHHIVDKEIQSGRKIKVVDTPLRMKIERFIDSYGPEHVAKYNQRNS
ncbi:hypothetical protein K501DRAFT_260728 [Backusella circina FSU 941]|nr:hypothetical protein K501DRAFT_260728 [Backusella circina FSU 941]